MALHPNKHSNGKTIGYKHKSQLKPTGRWDITAAKFMKKLLSILIVMMSLSAICNAEEYNFEDYIYPFGSRTFSTLDANGKTISVSQYSFVSEYYDNYLVEEVYIGMGMQSATNYYRYRIVDNTVISDLQIKRNRLSGSTKYQDKRTLFAFPNKDKPYTWSETEQGEKIEGKSEYVYVLFQGVKTKAIKITENISFIVNNVKHKHLRKSYWIEGYGRVVTYYRIDGGKERIQSIAEMPVAFDGVTELPSHEK